MRFNVVISNPPYNRGIDIDFVNLGFDLSTDYCVMITPAKWQTAEANQKIASKMSYGEFRKKIVPHMSKVVFYPDCLDVFGISQPDGITYYLINKNVTFENKCIVENKCNLQTKIVSEQIRDITHQQSLWNIGQEMVEYFGKYNRYTFENIINRKKYTVNINTQLRQSLSGAWDWKNGGIDSRFIGKGGYIFSQNGHNIGVLDKTRALKGDEKSPASASRDVFTSDSIDESTATSHRRHTDIQCI